MKSSLRLVAGPQARAHIEQNGLSPEDISFMPGAAGGPKWLALAGLDRYLFGHWFKDRKAPLPCIGSSVGTWRFAAASQADPLAAQQRFLAAYLDQSYSAKPDAAEVTQVAGQLLDSILGEDGVQNILQHPWMRPMFVTALCHGWSGVESYPRLPMGLMRLVADNLRGREHLGKKVERVIFHHPDYQPDFLPIDNIFKTHTVALDEDNLRRALMASASIPMLMLGERDIAGSPLGMHRDGGLVDYHFDTHFQRDQGIVLFPHFSTRVVRGWLDKSLKKRQQDPAHFQRTLLIAPSEELLARLPNKKIPDREDFKRYGQDTQSLFRDWRTATQECDAMADELQDLIETEKLAASLEVLPT